MEHYSVQHFVEQIILLKQTLEDFLFVVLEDGVRWIGRDDEIDQANALAVVLMLLEPAYAHGDILRTFVLEERIIKQIAD